jgi:hypothetical protein
MFDAGASTLGTQLGGGSGIHTLAVYFFEAAVGGTFSGGYICQVQYDGDENVLVVDLGSFLAFPDTTMERDIAFSFAGPNGSGATGALSLSVEFSGFSLVAETKGGLVPRSEVTYRQDGVDKEVTDGMEWLDVLGKLDRFGAGAEPLSLNTLWQRRTETYNAVFRSFIAFLENNSMAGIKYTRPYNKGGAGLTSIEQLGDIVSWIYDNGPFANFDRKRIERVLNWLWMDLQNLIAAVDVSALVNSEFANDNGYCA